MLLVNVFTIVYIIAMLLLHDKFIVKSNTKQTMGVKKKANWINLCILLALGLVVRCILAKIDQGYETDMSCFSYWSDAVYNQGIKSFYTSDFFTDYPPGYMYVLWVIGKIRASIPSLVNSTILLKMPAMLCDLATAALVYKIAKKRFSEWTSILFTVFYLFNPVVLIDSAMWGQVDSIFTLFIALMVYLVSEKKLIPSYFVFAIAILVKPQALVLTPVLLCAILDQVILKNFSWKRFLKELGFGLLAIIALFICTVPFHFDEFWVQYAGKALVEGTQTYLPVDSASLTQAGAGFFLKLVQMVLGLLALYTGTMTSYPKATVNAYNFWGMLGKNWCDQTDIVFGMQCATWGTIFIVVTVILCLAFCYFSRNREAKDKYFFYGAFVALGFFTLSVRVHERYMFPVLILLILAYIYKPRKEYIYGFLALTLVSGNNVWHAFKFYPDKFQWGDPFVKWVGFLEVCVFAYVLYIGIRYFIVNELFENRQENVEQSELADTDDIYLEEEEVNFLAPVFQHPSENPKVIPSDKKKTFTKYDWIAIFAITIIYGIIALYNLGNKEAPESSWRTEVQNDASLVFDFSNKQGNITKIKYFLGNYENLEFTVHQSADGQNWYPASVNGGDPTANGEEASKFTMTSVFAWGETPVTIVEPYVRIVCNSYHSVINELVFFDESGNPVVPVNAQSFAALFDEQDLCPEISTFRDSTYFDEIYHARTAYEMAHPGTYCYENTHPPLGKLIISIGVRIFGMCPFGWRIMGTLFGIAMLPFFYLFARKIFGETWIATVTTTLFAADFMHFAQTRIATIDVFVTFFIILMYYFMYQYTRFSFYDTSLKRTFVPLLCCGISMGLGCAAKWPGVYAGIGLGVIFFAVMIRRYLEYRYARADINGESNGISHEHIKKSFKGNLIKTLAFCIVAFVIIPGTIYTLSYIPFNDSNEVGLISYVVDEQPVEDGSEDTSSTILLEDGSTIGLDTRYVNVSIRKPLAAEGTSKRENQIKWNGNAFNKLLGRMIRNQVTMFTYHSQLVAEHPYSSWWYQWPIMYRPIWYYTQTVDANLGIQENISAFGNPLVWWAGIPAFLFVLYLAMKNKDRKAAFLCVGYMAQLGPWMNVSRITFIYHYFPSVIFITLMIGYSMYKMVSSEQRVKARYWIMAYLALTIIRRVAAFGFTVNAIKEGSYAPEIVICVAMILGYLMLQLKKENAKKSCYIYAGVVVILFIMFYPVLSGYPVNVDTADKMLRWFDSWQLISK